MGGSGSTLNPAAPQLFTLYCKHWALSIVPFSLDGGAAAGGVVQRQQKGWKKAQTYVCILVHTQTISWGIFSAVQCSAVQALSLSLTHTQHPLPLPLPLQVCLYYHHL